MQGEKDTKTTRTTAAAANIEGVIRVLDIVIAIGRYLLPITVALSLLSVAASLNSAAGGNIAGAVFWAILALAGAIFAVQVVQKRKAHRKRTAQRLTRKRQEYAGAAEA